MDVIVVMIASGFFRVDAIPKMIVVNCYSWMLTMDITVLNDW